MLSSETSKRTWLSGRLLLASQARTSASFFCTTAPASSSSSAKTGILMLNMGGPKKADEVEDFLTRFVI